MKTALAPLLIAALTASSTLLGQVYTPSVGYVTLNLQAGNNFVGFSLQPSQVHQGVITVNATDRSRITFSNASFSDDQFNPATVSASSPSTHVIEVLNVGASQGINTAVIDTVGASSELYLQDALPAAVANGSSVRIWKLWTIGDAFGATNTAGLQGGTSVNTADAILIPNSTGGYDQYYYSTGGFAGVGWRRNGGGNTNRAGLPLYLTDGFLISAKAPKSITITGQVKSGATTIVLDTGNNFITNLCPVNAGGASPSTEGRTLGNSGFYTGNAQTGLAGGTSLNVADVVLIWNGTGYDQYYYSTGGFAGVGWRRNGGGNTDRAPTALPDGSFIIVRRGAPVSVQLAQGSF
jgi:hypothetical protein